MLGPLITVSFDLSVPSNGAMALQPNFHNYNPANGTGLSVPSNGAMALQHTKHGAATERIAMPFSPL